MADTKENSDKTYPNTETQRLSIGGRSRVMVTGIIAVCIGSVLGAIGIAIVYFSDDILAKLKQEDTPSWVVQAAGASLIYMSAALLLTSVMAWWRKSKHREPAAPGSRQACMAQYPWDPSGINDDNVRRAFQYLGIGIMMALFLTPFHWVALNLGAVGIFFGLFLVLFDVAILALVFVALRKFFQLLKYGRARLTFKEFPFFTGRKMNASLHLSRGHHQLNGLEFRLLFVEEVIETTQANHKQCRTQVCYGHYEDRQVFDPHDLDFLSTTAIPVSFEIPDLVYESNLAQVPPCYWLLEVKAKAIGVDFDTSFLLPVYSKTPRRIIRQASEESVAEQSPQPVAES